VDVLDCDFSSSVVEPWAALNYILIRMLGRRVGGVDPPYSASSLVELMAAMSVTEMVESAEVEQDELHIEPARVAAGRLYSTQKRETAAEPCWRPLDWITYVPRHAAVERLRRATPAIVDVRVLPNHDEIWTLARDENGVSAVQDAMRQLGWPR
jgi:hypothetical protein